MIDVTPANAVPLRLSFKTDDPGFSVLEASGRFAMSQLWEVELVVQHADSLLVPAAFRGRNARLDLVEEPGQPALHGVVVSMSQASIEPSGLSRYRIRLSSKLWWWTKYRDTTIRLDMRVDEVVSQYLVEHELPGAVAALSGEHPARPYRVQYHETDAAFVFRALAEDGVAWYFDFASEASNLVLTDDTAAHQLGQLVVLPFAAHSQLAQIGRHAYEFSLEATQEYESVQLRDRRERTPRFDAAVEHGIGPEAAGIRRVDFIPGVAGDEAELRRAARDILDAEQATTDLARIKTTAFVWPGQRLALEGGPREEAAMVRTAISTASRWSTAIVQGSSVPVCEHEIVALDARRRFLPTRPPKARIHGIQTATVTGDGEIDVDTDGRVQLTFPWDPTSTSVRVRVAQAWAGPQYGLVCIPRVGDEVLVAYLDGDPEQPMIVGRVFNGLNQMPLNLPADQTVSVWRTRSSPGGDGYNEIRLDDKAGEERFDVHAQRDASLKVERDAETWIGRNASLTIAGDQRAWIDGSGDLGFRKVLNLSGEKTTLEGRSDLTIKGPLTNMIADLRYDVVSGNLQVNSGNELHVAKGLHRVDASHIALNATGSISITCGGSAIILKPGSISIESSGPVDVKGAPIKLNC
jgi:type VI secretion system secreted protein VgrG